MSRSAAEVLEFDQLKEIVGGYHHLCARTPRDRGFGTAAGCRGARCGIRAGGEAVSYLRAGSELGFGSFADPEQWLARLAVPAAVLSSRRISGCEFADGDRELGCGRHLKLMPRNIRSWQTRAAALGGFSASGDGDSPRDFAER